MMMIYLAFASVITMVLAAGVCFGVIACAPDTEYDEIAREVSRLGYRALAELETARADILRLGEKLDASSAPEPASSHYARAIVVTKEGADYGLDFHASVEG